MKKFFLQKTGDEEGFVLIVSLLIMLILTIIGIAATTNTSLELRIAGNDKTHKETFYTAEAGAILGAELLEQNINCVTGFASTGTNSNGDDITLINSDPIFPIQVETLDFAYNQPGPSSFDDLLVDDKADIFFPVGNQELSFLYVYGDTKKMHGGSLIGHAGYERLAKSSAAGGTALEYDIYSRHIGLGNSESIVLFGWTHLVGMESACNYD